MLGLTVVSVVVIVVAGGADDPDSTASDSVNWLKVALGLAFFAMALRQWRKRPKRGETPTLPKWMETIDHFTPGRSFVFGGDHATKPLASIKEFMEDHNAVIMMVVLLVLGAKLIGDGIPGL